MSLAFSGRRLPGSPLATMEGQGCGAVGSGGPKVGLSGPLCVGSSSLCGSHSSAELFSFVHQGGDRGIDRQRGCRTRPVVSRFLQSPVRGPEGFRVVEPCDLPVVIERVRSTYAVQDGIQPVGSPVHQEFRLDDLHRSQGCLPSGSNSSIQQEVPEVCCMAESINSRLFVSVSPRPLKCSQGSWLRCRFFSTARAFVCYAIWMTG